MATKKLSEGEMQFVRDFAVHIARKDKTEMKESLLRSAQQYLDVVDTGAEGFTVSGQLEGRKVAITKTATGWEISSDLAQ